MKKNTTQSGKKGGLLDGPSHDNGGIPVVVKSTNEPIEVEGGEIIINKEASKKHCKLLSKINQSAGNGIEIPCDCENCSNGDQAKRGTKTSSLISVLNNPKSKQLIEEIEELSIQIERRPTDLSLINIKKNLILELKQKFNYNYIEQAKKGTKTKKIVLHIQKSETSYHDNYLLWLEILNKNKQLPIFFTKSESRKDFGDSFYINIFDTDWRQLVKIRFSGHSVTNLDRVFNEIHNPNISTFYSVISKALSSDEKKEHPENSIIWEHNPQKAKRGTITPQKDYSNADPYAKAIDEWNAKFNSWVNGQGKINTITELNEQDIDYTNWTDLDIFSWSEKQDLRQAKKGKYIFPIGKGKKPKPNLNLAPEFTFEETIIGIEQKYMEGADRILTMADGQEKVTQATRDALLEWILEPANNTKVIIAFSGGKDSVAMVLHAFNLGIKKEQIELWHHDIDGHGEELFDWACTPSYCQAFADHFGLPLLFSYRKGGIAREIQRTKETSQDVYFQKEAKGDYYVAKSVQVDKYMRTKNMFPAITTSLKKRWCSASAKIEVMSKAITNNPKFNKGNFVIMTGERRAESTGRSHYNEIEPYANMSQNRRAITWRPIIDFSEKEVWDLMKSKKIQPHPCYMLGWGRCSCQLCIFGDGATWKSIQDINPAKVERIAELESQNAERNSKIPTLHAKGSKPIGIKEWIDTQKEPKERDETQPPNKKGVYPYKKYPKGHVQPLAKSFIKPENKDKWKDQAQGTFTMPIIVQGEWVQPQGAFSKKQCGAT